MIPWTSAWAEKLTAKLNEELEHLPPGPERNEAIQVVARRMLEQAETDDERLYWEYFMFE